MPLNYSSKELMNEAALGSTLLHTLTDEERLGMKTVLLDMYDDLATLCKKYNLCLMLGGGSCLGAVRHKGFIPWDDDLDLMMPRQDYDILLRLLKEGALDSNKYEHTFPWKGDDSPSNFLKIYRRNTINQDISLLNSPFPQGIYIDIFPIEGAPNNKLLQSIKGFLSFTLRGICTCTTSYKYSNSLYQDYAQSNDKLRKAVVAKNIIGHIFSVIPRKIWFNLFDFVTKENCKPDKYVTIPTGRNHYIGELQHYDIFFPTEKLIFEGRSIPVPHDYKKYLEGLYGNNYMQLPPIEKRERHFVYKFKLPEEN